MSLAVTFKLGKFANVKVLFPVLSTDFPQLVVSKVEKNRGRVYWMGTHHSNYAVTQGPKAKVKYRAILGLPPRDKAAMLVVITIGHFRVPKTLTFKMRPSVQPFLWKWVLFAWEWKIICKSKTEHLTFWYIGLGELGNGLFATCTCPIIHLILFISPGYYNRPKRNSKRWLCKIWGGK